MYSMFKYNTYQAFDIMILCTFPVILIQDEFQNMHTVKGIYNVCSIAQAINIVIHCTVYYSSIFESNR